MPSGQVVQRLVDIIGHGRQGFALARRLAKEGVRTRADLKKSAILARLPRESRANVLYNPTRNTSFDEAKAISDEVKRRLVVKFADLPRSIRLKVIPVGSVRRKRDRVKDLDFLIVVPPKLLTSLQLKSALAAAQLRPARRGDRVSFKTTYAEGSRRRSLILRVEGSTKAKHYRADLFVTTTAEKPFALFHFTGGSAYNIRVRAHAKRKGWKLNQYGLFNIKNGHRVHGSSSIRTERDLARFLDITYRHPKNRNEENGPAWD